MELIELYKGILESLDFHVDEHGRVHIERISGLEPFTVKFQGKDRYLVLPTQEILRDPDWENNIAFHPLSENVARKDSVIFQMLQGLASVSVNAEISMLMSTLVRYCADKDQHKHMNHKQTKFLNLFPDADDTSLKNWEKLDSKLGTNYTFASIYTLRNKALEGQTYPRVTYVKFPFFEDCTKLLEGKQKEYTIFGVKLRKKDVIGFSNLFQFLLSGADTPEVSYSVGSRSTIAPSFHSLMSSTYKLKVELQKTARLLKMDNHDLVWGKYIDDLAQYKGHIPVLQGNDGELTEGERRRNEHTLQPTTPPQGKLPVINHQQPNPLTQPVNTVTAPVTTTPVMPTPSLTQPVQQAIAPKPQVKTVGNRNIPVMSFNQQPAQPQVAYPQPIPMMAPQQPVYQQPMMQSMQPATVPVQQPMQQPVYQRPVDQNGRPINTYSQAIPVQQPMQGGYMGQPMYQQPMYPTYGQPQPMMGNPYMVGYPPARNGW